MRYVRNEARTTHEFMGARARSHSRSWSRSHSRLGPVSAAWALAAVLGAGAAWLWLAPACRAAAPAAGGNLPAPAQLLKFRPTLPGVECDTPTAPEAIAACKVEMVVAHGRSIGYALKDGQGKMLRRFVDSNGSGRMNQWSYYEDGFEVYRELDLNGDHGLDEARWLNSGGTRVATVAKGKVAGWKRLSAEEASKVLVQGLVQARSGGDLSLLESVMASAAELSDAGLPREVADRAAAAVKDRAARVEALWKGLVGWNAQTLWSRFDGASPHLVPADPAVGLAKDLTLYENVMVFPTTPAARAGTDGQAPRLAFLQAPDLVRLGEVWKFVELPGAVDPDKPVVTALGGVRAALFEHANRAEPRDAAVDAALKALADYDGQNAAKLQGSGRDVARYHIERIPLLRAVIKAVSNPDDQLGYHKQIIDSLNAALRGGAYPEGREGLRRLSEEKGEIGAYAAYCLIGAEFALKNEQPGTNFLANQKAWMADLKKFLETYPRSDEAPEVLLQLASANEFNLEEKAAREQYARVVADYPETPSAKKAAGSLRRLDLEGKPLSIKGTGPDGATVDSSQLAGKPVLVVFWASWAAPVKDNLPGLLEAQKKYKDRGLEIIGVNLDDDRAAAEEFLKANPLPWRQILEEGGMSARLATEYGITFVPTMFLADGRGNVVNRNLRTASDVERQLEKMFSAAPASSSPSASERSPRGVALDRREQ